MSSSDVWTRHTKVFCRLAAIVNNVLVFRKTKPNHNRNPRAMLQCSRERGERLNPDKCQICITEVSYLGHILSQEGSQKVKAIREMQPTQKKTMLGMINYFVRFSPRLSEINAQLQQLLKHDSKFVMPTITERSNR